MSPFLILVTVRPVWRSASEKASASVALEMTFNSTPRCTMVCAICGLMPLIMQSAPISRAAATVFSRCCAVKRIDRWHAGDVDDGDLGLDVHDRLQQVLHHHLRSLAVQRSDQRQCKNAVPQFDDRRRQFSDLALLANDDLFAALLEHIESEKAEFVEKDGRRPDGRGDLLRPTSPCRGSTH